MSRFGLPLLLACATLLPAVGGNLLAGGGPAPTAAPASSGAETRLRVKAAAAHWPLRFEENVGQVRGPEGREVRYLSRGSAYTLFLTSSEAVLMMRHPFDKTSKASPVVVRMRLAGASQFPAFRGEDELPGKSNYFTGADPAQWRTGIANYSRVAAKDVYPGIDLIYHGNQGQLEYDFAVAPQADPRKIRLALEGAKGLRIDSRGDLLVKVPGGDLCFRRPVAYQTTDGVQRMVPARYALKGKNQVEFRLASYDARRTLVIDPILSYSTFLGGSSIDAANGIAVAPDGTAFVAGGTFSHDFPTEHPLQPSVGGPNDFPQDAFVAKVSADGSTLLYSTYLGGSNQDVANAIAVDAAGEAFVAGTTFSSDFPVTAGAVNTLCGGDGKCGATWNPQGFIVSNAFVTKLNVAGSGLVYSTFLGYYENVQAHGIAVDSALNAYVTGDVGPNITPTVPIVAPNTPPPNFPVVHGFQTTFGGSGTDGFITKIDASDSEILYSSYVGGSDEDVAYGVAVDRSANAYVTGLTYSTDFPTSATPLQSAYSGAGDAFLSKINTGATGAASLVYSTYLGGTGLEQGNAVAVDAGGDAYVTGLITSKAGELGFTPPAGAFQTECALDTLSVCEGDAYVGKFDPTQAGSASLLYFTYLGGSLADSGAGVAVDASGNAYISGSTVSPNFPHQGAVFQPQFGGGNADAFVMELAPDATALVYSTFLGGSNTDTASGIAIDTSGGAYVAGQTCSLDFPLAAPLQAAPGGNCDAFVTKIIPSGGFALSPAGLVFPNTLLGSTSSPETITINNGGNTAISISTTTITGTNAGDFAIQNNTCGSSVGALSTCTISVTFSPVSVTPATRTAQLTLVDSAPGSPHVVDLTGTAGSTALVSLSPTTLAFSTEQAVGVTSAPLTLTVTNPGSVALNISNVVLSNADFAISSNHCNAPLQATTPPSNCTILVTYTPSVAGASVGSLTITDNAPDSPQLVLLTGTGVLQPVASLSTSSLNFGDETVNITSAAQNVTVTNTGTAPLIFTSPRTPAGPFAETDTCSSPIAPQGVCVISVTFTPTAAGTAAGSLTLTGNAANSPQTIALGGTGVTAPAASLSPTNLTFTSQNVGSTSPAQTVTLSNAGIATLLINNIAVTGDFGSTNTCGASLAAASSCSINVTFTPTAVGNRYGTLTVTDNANGIAGSTQVIPLEGTGQGVAIATFSAPSLTFAAQQVGTSSASQSVTLSNTGTATMSISSIVPGGDFTQSNNCGSSLAIGAACTIAVTFTPTASGTRTGSLVATSDASNSPQTVSLTGTGTDFTVAVNPASVSVLAGNSTSVGVSVGSMSGFTAAVALSCTGMPTLATCTPNPATVSPGGATPVAATLNITTTRRTAVPPRGWPRLPGPGGRVRPEIWLLCALLLMSLVAWSARRYRPRWSWAVLALTALWLASFAACGSSAGGAGYVNPTGTPSGVYTITVSGTSGGQTRSTTFSLTVQ